MHCAIPAALPDAEASRHITTMHGDVVSNVNSCQTTLCCVSSKKLLNECMCLFQVLNIWPNTEHDLAVAAWSNCQKYEV